MNYFYEKLQDYRRFIEMSLIDHKVCIYTVVPIQEYWFENIGKRNVDESLVVPNVFEEFLAELMKSWEFKFKYYPDKQQIKINVI